MGMEPNHYRLQRSWGKVMFSQACVILFTRGSASVHAGIPTPQEQTNPSPWEQTPPRTRYSPDQAHPLGADTTLEQTPQTRHPPGAEHAGRYSQCAGSKHPTGMQSCCNIELQYHILITDVTLV